jgi:hypothetical protein
MFGVSGGLFWMVGVIFGLTGETGQDYFYCNIYNKGWLVTDGETGQCLLKYLEQKTIYGS